MLEIGKDSIEEIENHWPRGELVGRRTVVFRAALVHAFDVRARSIEALEAHWNLSAHLLYAAIPQ